MSSFWLLVPLLVLVYAAFRVVRRGLQLRQLVEDGVEVTGVVVRRTAFNGSGPRSRYLRYEYRGPDGRTYTHRSLVTADFWNAHREGDPIAVVCSASRPHVSAPLQLVEQGRAALARRQPA